MNRKTLLLALVFISLVSCNDVSIKSDTSTYKIELEKASGSHSNFTNSFGASPLYINAERINLKDIFGILLKTDTSNIKFQNDRVADQYYTLTVEQKDREIQINEPVLNEILTKLKLRIDSEESKSYKLMVKDSLRYSRLMSNSQNNISMITRSKDSITIKNCDLKQLSEIINSEFSERIVSNNDARRINYKWKRTPLDQLKPQLERSLGIVLVDMENDYPIYTVREN
jgi:hypothetical protein